MDIYYLVFFVAFLLVPLDFLRERLLGKTIYIAFCCFIVFLPAMRQIGIDNDSLTYEGLFYSISDYSFIDIVSGNYWENIERGFALLIKIVDSLGGDIHTLLVIVAVLTGIINYTFFYKFTPYPFLALFFYLSFFYLYRDFTQIRYGLSCSILFWTVIFFRDNRYKLSAGTLLLAILFHNTAFIFLLALPFVYYVKNKLFYFVFPFVSLVGFIINPFPFLLKLGFVPSHMFIYSDEQGGAGLSVSVFGYFIMLLYLGYSKKFDSSQDLFFRLLALSSGINLLFISSAIFQRFSYSFFQFGIIVLTHVLYKTEKSELKTYMLLVHLLICVLFLMYGCKLVDPELIKPYVFYDS